LRNALSVLQEPFFYGARKYGLSHLASIALFPIRIANYF
jgi:hypothetical protein